MKGTRLTPPESEIPVVNPYQSPQAVISDSAEYSGAVVLASRWQRLGAAIIDILLSAILTVPIWYIAYKDPQQFRVLFEENELLIGIVASLSVIGFFFLCHGILLARYGQTVGKRMLGIAIVDFKTNQILSLKRVIGARYVPQWLVGFIPLLSSILPLINVLAIFGKEKRCIHDLLANTKVVKVRV